MCSFKFNWGIFPVFCLRQYVRQVPSFIGGCRGGGALAFSSSSLRLRPRTILGTTQRRAEVDGGDTSADRFLRGHATPWENPKSLMDSLLERTTARALSTISSEPSIMGEEDTMNNSPSIEKVLDATIVRSSSILDGERNNIGIDANTDNENGTKDDNSQNMQQHQDKRTYLGNPSVTPTALAHSLWQSTILPYEDTVIDATCGNGKDCLALAKMLFPDTVASVPQKPQLIGIDIQSRAVHNTKRSLLSSLPSNIYYDHVLVLEQSHEHLMDVPSDKSSVGLVCYNLGYLPGSPSQDIPNNYKECQTQTETTLNSITDASLLLRVGGLLSIMTYPGSNLEESIVVEHFVEGLAMLTTRDPGGWRGYAANIPDYDHDGGRIRMLVTQALDRVVAEGAKKQTWRAFVHKPLGRPLSPVLVTAMRIK